MTARTNARPGLVYLDHNATSPVAPEVTEAMLPFFGHAYGNPSSSHTPGVMVARHLAVAREQVAALLGCAPSALTFTSGGTESNNIALFGLAAMRQGRKHLITSRVEHPAVLAPLCVLQAQGYELTLLPVDAEGLINPDDLRAAMRPDETALVSIMWANNETGVISPMTEIAALCAEAGVPLHTDAVQAAGKIPVDLAEHPGITTLALAGHKIHGPKGSGALYVRPGTCLTPLMYGGAQENCLRPGTENTPAVIGLGVACELAGKYLTKPEPDRAALRDRFEEALFSRLEGISRNGHALRRTPNTANLAFAGVAADCLLLLLNEAGLAASAGSACHSGNAEPSRILTAMGCPREHALSSIRFSLSRYTTPTDIDLALEVLAEAVPEARAMRPYTDPAAIAAYSAAQP